MSFLLWRRVDDATPKDRPLLLFTPHGDTGVIDIGQWWGSTFDVPLEDGSNDPGWYVNGSPARQEPSHYIDIFAIVGRPQDDKD